MSNTFKKILVVGAGTLGIQIARVISNHGDVVLCDLSKAALRRAKSQLSSEYVSYIETLDGRISDCDLVIESVTEVAKLKQQVFKQIESLVGKDTILATNSSMLLPRKIAKMIKDKSRFCAYHFYWPEDGATIVDIMPIKQTADNVIEKMRMFSLEIGLDPVDVMKENAGYVFNVMFGALNSRALSLVIRGVSTIEDVDKSFRNVVKCPLGPFQMMDIVGLDTVLHIAKNQAKRNPVIWFGVRFIKKYVQQGKLGRKTGEGFYKYDQEVKE